VRWRAGFRPSAHKTRAGGPAECPSNFKMTLLVLPSPTPARTKRAPGAPAEGGSHKFKVARDHTPVVEVW
jgi:hypothetical protein